MAYKISFGTDGWRGVIAEDYTFDNVRRAAQGFASYLVEKGNGGKWIVVSHDKRFHSENFAAAAAEVLAANGLNVYLTDGATPTPVIAYAVVDKKACGAVNITASHNPPTDNGFKVRDENGGAIDPEGLKRIEALIPDSAEEVKRISLNEGMRDGKIVIFDASEAYVEHLHELVDIQGIKDAGFTIMVDAMWGNGAGWFTKLLEGGKTRVVEIHNERNTLFPDMRRPEPIPPNINVGLQATVKNNADILLVTDGDADRCGVGDESGNFINQMQVYALLAYYLLELRGWSGPLVKTTTTTQMVDDLANKYNVPVYTVKIGFKHAAPKMIEVNALMAGEESGSYAFRGLPERDGILAGLFLLDFMQKINSKASGLLEKVESVIGKYYFKRQDIAVDANSRKAIQEFLVSEKILKENAVDNIDLSDGVKYVYNNGDWLFFRFSGTEPVIRIAAETKDQKRVEELLQRGVNLILSKTNLKRGNNG